MDKYYLLTGFYASSIISALQALKELKPVLYKISECASREENENIKYFISVNFPANGVALEELYEEKRAQIEKVCKKHYGLFVN